MPDNHLLTQDARPLVNAYLAARPPEISEHTFTNLFVWRHGRPVFYREIGDSLVFLVQDAAGGTLLFGPPVGTLTIREAATALGEKFAGVVRLPIGLRDQLREAGLPAQADRANADYVYRVEDLAELAGRRYAKKRNRIKQCLASHRCEYESLTENLIPECIALQEEWCRLRNCPQEPGLCHEFTAIGEAFTLFREFSLIGGAIRVDGMLRAFAIAEPLRPGTAVWHFEKAMPDIPGLGQLITNWFARHGLAGFEYVNREQDLGIPGLRQAKESYFPDHLVEKLTTLPPDSPPQFTPNRSFCI
ncbi:MAG: hypothetical protein A2521_09705 [Deltaproteobacteria bacterium RIFOXYD12_FULL_57_12]|nr:MAG: hypothetical protein A2521_09705 [Deltaproteobacteria bacterium RIFOXYD12_FULL_57_12]